VLYLSVLSEDFHEEIRENYFEDVDGFKDQSQVFDFGGYFSIENFSADMTVAIKQLFVHALNRLTLMKGEQESSHLLTGDDLTAACYNSTRGFAWSDRFYFRYACVTQAKTGDC